MVSWVFEREGGLTILHHKEKSEGGITMANVFDIINDDAVIKPVAPDVVPAPEPAPAADFWTIVKKPTGSGAVDDYLNHPLNFSQSAGLGQLIRGLTGLLGALDYAVVDIILGIFRVLMERRKDAG